MSLFFFSYFKAFIRFKLIEYSLIVSQNLFHYMCCVVKEKKPNFQVQKVN